jgi:integrase
MAQNYYVGSVTVRKREGKVGWYAYYRDGSGTQRLRSLKTRNLHEARARALLISEALNSGTDQRLEQVRDNRRVTFQEAVDLYLEQCELAARSLKEDRTRLLRICQDWGEIPISTINSGHIESWLAKNKRKSKWSSATRNRYLSAVKQVFKKAHGLNYLAENPALPLKATKEDENIPEPLTDDVVAALLEVLPEYARYMVCILVDTGLRMGELHRIRWQDVDTTGRRLNIYKSKSKQFRVVPMTPRLAALFDTLRTGHQWLQSQSGPSRKAIVWPDDSSPSAVVIPPIDIKKSLISAAKKIGAEHIHPHQFRHTYATRLMDQGVPMEHIMALGGWKSSAMAKRYARVNPVHLQKHADRLEELPGHKPVAP